MQGITVQQCMCIIAVLCCKRSYGRMLLQGNDTVAAAASPDPKLRSSSQCTSVKLINEWSEEVQIRISAIDNYDWDGDSRPDHNLEGQLIAPGTSLQQREEINAWASPHFEMTIIPTATQQVWFHARVAAGFDVDTGALIPNTEWLDFGAIQLHPEQFPMYWRGNAGFSSTGFRVFTAQGQEVFKFQWYNC